MRETSNCLLLECWTRAQSGFALSSSTLLIRESYLVCRTWFLSKTVSGCENYKERKNLSRLCLGNFKNFLCGIVLVLVHNVLIVYIASVIKFSQYLIRRF